LRALTAMASLSLLSGQPSRLLLALEKAMREVKCIQEILSKV
jgi:hypothetical protein